MDQQKSTYTIAGAIVVAGALIAAAVIYTGMSSMPSAPIAANAEQQPQEDPLENMAAVTPDDHIRGSIEAPVKIVMYSDFECPFCKRFYDTMLQVMDEYNDGSVAWVFRHFPLESLHPVKAQQEALASECAAILGGTDTFWQYTDILNAETLTNNRTDVDTLLPNIATRVGIDPTDLAECMAREETRNLIDEDITSAVESGGRGTPWSILEGPDGSRYPINGAQPIETVRQLIELAQG